MNNCVHQWIYIGSKRQDVWRCIFCDEYKINDATQKREWVGLTDEEIDNAFFDRTNFVKVDLRVFAKDIEAKLKEKNSV